MQRKVVPQVFLSQPTTNMRSFFHMNKMVTMTDSRVNMTNLPIRELSFLKKGKEEKEAKEAKTVKEPKEPKAKQPKKAKKQVAKAKTSEAPVAEEIVEKVVAKSVAKKQNKPVVEKVSSRQALELELNDKLVTDKYASNIQQIREAYKFY